MIHVAVGTAASPMLITRAAPCFIHPKVTDPGTLAPGSDRSNTRCLGSFAVWTRPSERWCPSASRYSRTARPPGFGSRTQPVTVSGGRARQDGLDMAPSTAALEPVDSATNVALALDSLSAHRRSTATALIDRSCSRKAASGALATGNGTGND